MEAMSVFEFMENHEQIKNLHDRVNNMRTIDKAHQKLNGELREEVKALRKDLDSKDKELGRMMNKINKLEKKLK